MTVNELIKELQALTPEQRELPVWVTAHQEGRLGAHAKLDDLVVDPVDEGYPAMVRLRGWGGRYIY